MYIIDSGDEWTYLDNGTIPDSNWMSIDYDDSDWSTGNTQMGYGDGDETTIINFGSDPNKKHMTVYFRKVFSISDTASHIAMIIHLLRDDGAIVYLNGDIIMRSNLPNGEITHNTKAITSTYGEDENKFFAKAFNPNRLKKGNNIIAVEVHQIAPTSSDLSFDFKLKGLYEGDSYNPYLFSNLPLIIINTYGQWIRNEPKITAHMGVIDNDSAFNFINDPFNNYDGEIGIELRGATSLKFFPKKQYAIETIDSLGAPNNVSLLGLPSENDWVLNAPYSDKSFMRNVITFKIANDMGRYASRSRFCEVYINGDYLGVYVLLEKIKRDDDRVDISRLESQDTAGDSLTGGYILKIDKREGSEIYGWHSSFPPYANPKRFFQYHYPRSHDITNEQKQYIQNYIYQFENSLWKQNYTDPVNGYLKYIDINSFVDYFLITELTKNVDGYRLSAYFYKDRDSKGGKLCMGPPWDYNIAFGNCDIFPWGAGYKNWQFNQHYENNPIPFWWEKMLNHSLFKNKVNTRWRQLRENTITINKIETFIDSLSILLYDAQKRNYAKWPILGEYVWPNVFIGNTYDEQVNWLKNWIINRIKWMDNNMVGSVTSLLDTVVINEINYHSSPDFDTKDWIELYNPTANAVELTNWQLRDDDDQDSFVFPPHTVIETGQYLVLCHDTTAFKTYFPDVKNLTGNLNFNLSNDGELLRLLDPYNNIVDSLTFNDNEPWPQEPDGTGATLELMNPSWDNAISENWAPSASYGTPGNRNSVYTVNKRPELFELERKPQAPTSRDSLFFTVKAIDDQTIDRVELHYHDGHMWQNTQMYDDGLHFDKDPHDGIFGISLAPFSDKTLLKYWILTMDNIAQADTLPKGAPENVNLCIVDDNPVLPGEVIFSEIMFNSIDNDTEFVEIYNNSSHTIEMNHWVFRDDENTHEFRFPRVSIASKRCLVICGDSSAVKTRFAIQNVIGNLDFNLGNGGDQVRLYNVNGVLIDSIEYDDDPPWPTEADGTGPSLELRNQNLDNAIASSWKTSEINGGTPGTAFCVFFSAKILLEAAILNPQDNKDFLVDIPTISPYKEDEKQLDTLPADIFDWILLQLKPVNGDTWVSHSVLLSHSGELVSSDGKQGKITNSALPGDYFILVNHRNHLPIMSSIPLSLNNYQTCFWDFSKIENCFERFAKNMGNDRWALYAGDVDGSGEINSQDIQQVWQSRNKTGYLKPDCGLNGTVDALDRAIIWNNYNIKANLLSTKRNK